MRALSFLGILAVLITPSPAQEGYRLPPPDVADLLTAPPAPRVSLSPDGAHMLLVQSEAMPSIADVSRPMLRLAGSRIDPAAHARFSHLPRHLPLPGDARR